MPRYESFPVAKESVLVSSSQTFNVLILFKIDFEFLCGLMIWFLLCFSVSDHWSWTMWFAYSHRAGLPWSQGGFVGEEGCILPKQCASSLALHHSGSEGSWSQEVLWQVLCWSHRPYQWVVYQAVFLFSEKLTFTVQTSVTDDPITALNVDVNVLRCTLRTFSDSNHFQRCSGTPIKV